MNVISIMNVKGGVGKTITAINTAEILAGECKLRVLLIDADPQADATDMLLGAETDFGLIDIVNGSTDYLEHIMPTRYRGLDLLGASSDLFNIPIDAAAATTENIAELMRSLRQNNAYDLVIIDCPPSFTATSVAAICNSDYVVIPVKLDSFGIRGAKFLTSQIEAMHDYNPNCVVLGALVTMWHNAAVCHQSLDMLRDVMDGDVFYAKIRRTDKADESTFYGKALSEYSRYSSAGRDYREFVKELIETINKEGAEKHAV